jgi:uncharacterized protein YjbK
MKQNREVEYKCLVDADTFARIKAHYNPKITIVQTNHYFDTPNLDLKAQSISCRIRQFADGAELTFKRKNGLANDELTFEDVTPGEAFLDPRVKALLAQWGIQTPLIALGVLQTERSLIHLAHGDLCLDHNHYHGVTDYELEYELSGDEKAGLAEFHDILAFFGIKWGKNAPAKVQRCVQAARASGFGPGEPHTH